MVTNDSSRKDKNLTPSPLFLKENSEELEVKSRVRSIVDKALSELDKSDKVPCAGSHNLVRGGFVEKSAFDYVLYQPHNYRRYFNFSWDGFSIINLGQKRGCNNYKVINNHEVYVSDFHGCGIRIKKNTVEVTNKIESHKWFKIDLGNELLIKQQFKELHSLKDGECGRVLACFISEYGGVSDCISYKRTFEQKIMRERAVDNIPIGMTFQNPIVKKVYKEHNVEFLSPEGAETYLCNRAIEKISPEIASILGRLERANLLTFLKGNIKCVQDVLEQFKDDVLRLSIDERAELGVWLEQASHEGIINGR